MPLFQILSQDGDEITQFSSEEFTPGTPITVGRSSTCSVCMKNSPGLSRSVGRVHFSLVEKGMDWWLHGELNTKVYRGAEQVFESKLRDGDRFRFGGYFLCVGTDAGTTPYKLFYQTTVGHINSVPLWQGKNWVGRSSKNTIPLEDVSGCSRRHVCLTVARNSIIIEDLKSSNGTRVGGTKIAKPTDLSPGQEFKAGKTKMWVDFDANAAQHLRRNTLWHDKYFRLFMLLLIIVILVWLKNLLFRGGAPN